MGGYGDIKLLKEDGLRLDGRKIDEMRPMKLKQVFFLVQMDRHGLSMV